jgi:anti-sigma-K factor RskA
LRFGLVAGLVLLLIGSNFVWWQQLQQVRQQLPMVAPTTGGLLISTGSAAAALNQVAISAPQPDAPQATLAWTTAADQTTWLGMFSVQQLPTLAEGTYQLWLIREGEAPLSMGVFNVTAAGTGLVLFQMSEPIGTFDQVGVTIEPHGGSVTPSLPLVLGGEI